MENLLSPSAPATDDTISNPAVPEKFLDKETKQIRVDALLKSYLELEKKLAQQGTSDFEKIDRQKLYSFLGVPDDPKAYQITISHDMFTEDDQINARLHEQGFTREQAQTVYDLAAEYLVPLVLNIAREYEAERQLDKLFEHFGGRDRYQEVARQLAAFGKKNLAPDVLEGLSYSYEGIMALYRMMQSDKPMAVQPQNAAADDMNEQTLRGMMKDPKYWREKDPAFIKKVSDGFRQVFAEHQS